MTEWLHFHFSLSCIGEGNGNPLQCSWLENPRDGGAWWAAVYGVEQSWTRLKWLSSSSSSVYICQCYFLNSSHALLPPLCPQDHPSCLNLYFLLKSIVSERTFSFAGSKECRSVSPVFPDWLPEKWRTRPKWLPAIPANKTPPKGPFPGVQMISSA